LLPYVDQVFSNPIAFDVKSSITATWLYAVQIYCDFSGYSDMAIAVAALLGYRLALNFDAPYLAVSIQDFWRRWHISLSSWIRDYIYISLGGRSGSRIKTYRNLLVTMLAGGLWHCASWTFVAWGGGAWKRSGLSSGISTHRRRFGMALDWQNLLLVSHDQLRMHLLDIVQGKQFWHRNSADQKIPSDRDRRHIAPAGLAHRPAVDPAGRAIVAEEV
jgi:D-alanyl-lipoteichoic acid acyltransferase DltB (MBOAT superfamily)